MLMRHTFLVAFVTVCAAAPADTPSIDLQNALERAKAYSQQFLSAGIAASLAREDRVQARAALLPTLNGLSQMIYTQPNGTDSGVFIANDGVHVYNQQAVVHAELFSATMRAEYRRARAAEAVAQAKRDIAARGLVATVTLNYYALVVAQHRLENAARSVDEAQRFLDITQKQESGGEVSHADVIKAQLQFQQRQRELAESATNIEKARLGLAVLLFSDVRQQFSVVDDLRPDAPLASLEEIRAQASTANPEIRAAEAGHEQAAFGVKAARGAYLPSLSFDYFYGINANVFGIHGPEQRQNLGSMVQGTLNLPVWNWGATRSKVRQAELQQRQAEIDLTFAKRQLQVNVNEFYLEAHAARTQLESSARLGGTGRREPAPDRPALPGGRGCRARSGRCPEHSGAGSQCLRRWPGPLPRGPGESADVDWKVLKMARTFLIIAGLDLILLCGCSKVEEKEAAPVVPVQVAAARSEAIQRTITADGILRALDQSTIMPKISAPVSKFLVNRGDHVQKGQLLAVLENRDLAAAVADAKGAYDQAAAAQRSMTSATVPDELVKAQTEAQAARQSLEAAQKLLASREKLYQEGALARRQVDEAGVAYAQAKSQSDTALKHLESVQNVTRIEDVKGAAGQLDSAKGKQEAAQAQLSYPRSAARSPASSRTAPCSPARWPTRVRLC